MRSTHIFDPEISNIDGRCVGFKSGTSDCPHNSLCPDKPTKECEECFKDAQDAMAEMAHLQFLDWGRP